MNRKPRFPDCDTLRCWIAPGLFFVLSWTAIAGQSEPGPPDLPATGFRDFSIAQYDYLDDGTRLTEAEILDAFLLSDLSVRAFYREASYNLLDMDLVELVDGITDLYPPQADCYPSISNVLIEVDEELEPDPYWPDIDQHLALVNNDCNKNSSTFGNQVGFPTLSHGVQFLPLAWMTAKPYPPGDFAGLAQSTWAHEIGHGLGIPMHSQAYKCFVNGPLSVNQGDCVNTRHQHDLMGYRDAATHFNGHFKDHFGWMPEANKTTIHSGGCHVIYLYDLAQPADPGQTQFVEIPLPHDVPAWTAGGLEIDFDVVTLEFRGHTGFDRRSFKLVPLADGGSRDVTAEVNTFGALVQALNCDEKQEPWHPCVTYEIDMQPNTMTDTNFPDYWDPIDGYLLEGETWEVPGNPIKITVLETIDAPESIEVLVEFGTAGPTWYGDTDGDGFGDPVTARTTCLQPAGYVANDTDCDDGDPETYPGALEINDGRDNQCPGDEGYGAVDEISGEVGFNNADDKNTYSWVAQPGATLYEVARSTAPDHSLDCTTVQTAETFWEDLEEPLPGTVFYYLTRPVEPHAGSWGQDSTSSERTNVCP